MNKKQLLERIERAAGENATELSLVDEDLTSLPPEIGRLTNLTNLNLTSNQLTSVPSELAQLTNLTELSLSANQLTSVPVELGQLTNLTVLHLSNNQLTSVPAEFGQLVKLTKLSLFSNQLTTITKELANLSQLRTLWLDNNNFSALPEAVEQLGSIESFSIDAKHIPELAEKMAKFPNLRVLYLDNQGLVSLPQELLQLTNLTGLYLHNNRLTNVPAELGQLTNLTELHLNNNQLTSTPAELGQLANLTMLDLDFNNLTSVPAELGRLTKLETLQLRVNRNLTSPPPEVVKQGTRAILAYLRGLEKAEAHKWEAKLLIVGEAGVGKTELVKALRGEEFGGESATEGVLIRPLVMKHPTKSDVTMRLNMWDFGGQEIQHATHQFFYSERALFLLAWNARENYEQAKLNDWLELIQARASVQAKPETGEEGWRVPVLLVATHRDLWRPDIPYQELERQFPGIRFLGPVEVSNKTRRGMKDLLKVLAEAGAELPLMGMSWPGDWQKVEDELAEQVKKKESRMPLAELWKVMADAEVSEDSRGPLTRALDGMGKIRAFLDDEELRETVVLDPQWLTSRIAKVLKNEDEDGKAICKHAILRRKHWGVFWSGEDEETQRLFVRMMRNFDLVYELEDSPDAWLVVQLLPYQLGEGDSKRMQELWSGFEGQSEITMKFRLEQSIPPGIPTWFIAREHRFSLEIHWRLGVLLADNPENPAHLALVQSYPEQRYVELTVRGPMPHNFFVILRDGLEYTLGRFPGLKIKKTFPCPGHDGDECEHEFNIRQLEKAVVRDEPLLAIQCPEFLQDVSVPQLLFGVHWSTQGDVFKRIDELEKKLVEGHEAILAESRELKELAQRDFTVLFNAQQELEKSHCPNVFAVLPKDGQSWLKNLFVQKMVLQLYCQAPGQWHPALEGGQYEIRKPSEFLKDVGPYILKLAKVIKYAAPVAGAAAGLVAAGPGGVVMGAAAAKKLAAQIRLMEELAKKLADRDYLEAELLEKSRGAGIEIVEKSELGPLRRLLNKLDPNQEWGGLKKVLTPEGHYLWLCEHHAAEYKK